MPRTSTRPCADGWYSTLDTTCTSRRPTVPGSTRSSAGSASSPSARSGVAPSTRSPIYGDESNNSRTTGTNIRGRSLGPPRQIPSSKNWLDLAKPSLGHHTRRFTAYFAKFEVLDTHGTTGCESHLILLGGGWK